MVYYVFTFILLALSSFHDVGTFHLKSRWNLLLKKSYIKEVGQRADNQLEEKLAYSLDINQETVKWAIEKAEQSYRRDESQEDSDYYPEQEIREYLEANPHILRNYLFKTSFRSVNHDDDDKVCPVVNKPFSFTKLPDKHGVLRYIVKIPGVVPNFQISYCNDEYPEKQNCSDLDKAGSEVSCQMMNETVPLLAGSFENNMFIIKEYSFVIPYYCTCMFVKK